MFSSRCLKIESISLAGRPICVDTRIVIGSALASPSSVATVSCMLDIRTWFTAASGAIDRYACR